MTPGPRSGRCIRKRPVRDRTGHQRHACCTQQITAIVVISRVGSARLRRTPVQDEGLGEAGILRIVCRERQSPGLGGLAGELRRLCWQLLARSILVLACYSVLESADAASAEAPVALQTFTTSVKVALTSTSHHHGSRSHFQWSSNVSVPLAFPASRLYVPVGRNRDVRLRHQPIPIVSDQWKDCSHCYS